MHRLNIVDWFIWLLTATLFLSPGRGLAQSSNSTSAGLSNGGFSSSAEENGPLTGISPANGKPTVVAIDPVYDFGAVYNGAVVKHTFRLKNSGTAPLVIKGVRTSCGCTTAQPTKNHLLPADDSAIAVNFDTASDRGPATRTVTVMTNDPGHHQLPLTMR